MREITLKEFEILDDEDNINNPMKREIGALVVMRDHERDQCVIQGDVVTLYEVIRLTDTGFEGRPIGVKVI